MHIRLLLIAGVAGILSLSPTLPQFVEPRPINRGLWSRKFASNL